MPASGAQWPRWPGAAERIDVGMVVEVGACEQVAVALEPVPIGARLEGKKKPLLYLVNGLTDQGTLKGVARLVYGDERKWVEIFEENRDVVARPSALRVATALTIPKGGQPTPAPLRRVKPDYPQEARQAGIAGDVVLDVRLRDNGTVWEVGVIEGHPLLAAAAVRAVREWRYPPVAAKPGTRARFVVVVTFGKDGKVQ
jgi:TonB family protein